VNIIEANNIIHNDLGICGCGSPEIVIKFVVKALSLIKARAESHYARPESDALNRHFHHYTTDNDLFTYMAWYFIDRAGLIEHGTVILGSWLTDKGKEFLEFALSSEGQRYLYDEEGD
jgi:hypothetical protein